MAGKDFTSLAFASVCGCGIGLLNPVATCVDNTGLTGLGIAPTDEPRARQFPFPRVHHADGKHLMPGGEAAGRFYELLVEEIADKDE